MEQKGNFQALTSLKGLFILIIVLHNTLDIHPVFSGVPGTAFLILFGGILGNSMFFILSGFLLSVGYRERIQGHRISFRDYILRRLKKLYPMYLLSNAAMLFIELIYYGVSVIDIRKIVFTLLLVGGPYNNPTWFLCALFVCYILYFAVAYFARSSTHYICFAVVGIIIGYTLMDADLNFLFLGSSNGMACMNFFLGCILAEVWPILSQKQHRWLQPMFLVLLPGLMYLMLGYGVELIAGDVRVCFAFAICPMILYLALVKGPCSRLLRFKGFFALGKVSSAVFFWHLVLYFVLYDLQKVVFGGSIYPQTEYIIYFTGMLVICAGLTKLQEHIRKSTKGILL